MFVNEKSYIIFVQGSLTWRTVNINVLWTQLEGDSLNLTKKKRSNFLNNLLFWIFYGYADISYEGRNNQIRPSYIYLQIIPKLPRHKEISNINHTALIDYISSEGTRRLNCVKNIDVDKFAFNTLQLATFPRSTTCLALSPSSRWWSVPWPSSHLLLTSGPQTVPAASWHLRSFQDLRSLSSSWPASSSSSPPSQ